MAEPVLRLKQVRKVYPMGKEKVVAVNNVSMDVAQGEICCLLGKSGCGKSTLLNMMAGLEKPTRGEIIFFKRHIERMNEDQLAKFRREYVGFVFQSYNLLSTMTALENVALPLVFRKVPKKERDERAMALLEAVGLGERANHKPNEMSGGQQQRVSIARAFINDPQVVFADEPTGNLDTKTTIEMMELIMSLVRKNNQTLVLVTHDLELADYCETIVHLSDGKVERIERFDAEHHLLRTETPGGAKLLAEG